GYGIGQKLPAIRCGRDVLVAGVGSKVSSKCWRRADLSKSPNRRGRSTGGLGPNDLRGTVLRKNVALVFVISRVNEEVKSTVRILHFEQKIGFPFRLFQRVRNPVCAFWNSKVIKVRKAEIVSG